MLKIDKINHIQVNFCFEVSSTTHMCEKIYFNGDMSNFYVASLDILILGNTSL
jgi:hypothetical protein